MYKKRMKHIKSMKQFEQVSQKFNEGFRDMFRKKEEKKEPTTVGEYHKDKEGTRRDFGKNVSYETYMKHI